MKPDDEGGLLRPLLYEAEEMVQRGIERACNAPPSHDLDTGELVRLEETLAVAAEAAHDAVSLRRRLRARAADGALPGEATAAGETSLDRADDASSA